ncbi:cupin domain-containing protein [Promicromonospora sp. MS192]|uniref:cupin domain-containing protein n=1 Tax=Promicromonospora sp. MS192 TaxID=3412684 RepID=UPI003C2BF6A6
MDQSGVYVSSTVEKPWGRESIFAAFEGLYVGKIIEVRGGESLSLQYHVNKTETITVLRGTGKVEYGMSAEQLASRIVNPGDTIHLPAGTLHRIASLEDLLFAEVSTAVPGWDTDVVRLEDRYGRAGTTEP